MKNKSPSYPSTPHPDLEDEAGMDLLTPLQYYQQQCRQQLILEDSQQLVVIEALDVLHHQLMQEHRKRSRFYAHLRKPHGVKGLYLWGGVGIGKTFLMDCLFRCIPFKEKMRIHFHQFMQLVHLSLKKYAGKKDPLQYVARDIAKKNIVLCFDELSVSDITDAMLLGRLFAALFSKGVCLITTSNVAPDNLYKDGLQRGLFLPAIDLIKQHTHVRHLPSVMDYRTRYLMEAGVFHTPNDEASQIQMERSFSLLTIDKIIYQEPIEILGRKIRINKRSETIIWFDFEDICHVPRSQLDYLALVRQFDTIFISNIPVISSEENNRIAIFIRLIDVLYDANIRLVFSAETAVEQLYTQGNMIFEYARTCSRLLEMQSEAYFSHKRHPPIK